MKQLLTKSLPFLAILLCGMAQAQTTFWSEDFSSGIPMGWTNVDATGQGVIWEFCPDNVDPTCAPVFVGQSAFNSTTAATGFVHVNSDGAGNLATSAISRLTTSAIDCSSQSVVYLEFQSHVATYVDPIETNAIVRVSTDLMSWTEFTVFPDLIEANYFSENPYFSAVDISSVAANQATVYIQWQWTHNFEYMWDLDDIVLKDQNPTPKHNLAIGEFFYAASSLAQPVSQIATDTFGFFAYVSNPGLEDQTNIILKASVTTDLDEELFADSVLVPALAAGVMDSLIDFGGVQYAPELPVGSYKIKYSLRADSMDLRPADNRVEDVFLVTNSIYSKDLVPEIATSPLAAGDWNVGNLYTTSAASLDQYQAVSAIISFATDPAELLVTDVEATVYLFRVSDDAILSGLSYNFDDADFLSPDLEWLGVGTYEAPDTVQNFDLQEIPLLDFNSNLPGVVLEKGARYLLVVGYAGASNVTRHAFYEGVNMLFPSTFTYTTQWFTGGFGGELNAVIRMPISLVTTTDNKPLAESTMSIFPNPIRETLNLAVDFDQPTNVTITIADMTGRVIVVEDREGLTNNQLTYQLPQLASGTYLARIATEEGTLTKKFIVQK